MEVYKISEYNIVKVDFKEFHKDKYSKYWILISPEELAEYNKYFGFHGSTIQECLSRKQHPRIEVYDDVNFGVLNVIEAQNNYFTAKELNFYLGHNYLVFVVRGKYKLIDNIKNEVFDNVKNSAGYIISLSKLLYMLLDKLTSSDNSILSDIENKIALLEEKVIQGIEHDYTNEIVRLRKQLLFLKRHYEPLLDIGEALLENENGLIEESALRYFKILLNKIDRLNRNVLNLRDYITQVREAYQAQVDISLNKIMKVFTVITAIFLPLSLIAGWYGMNFKYMPELNWVYGYPFAFLLSGIVVAICLIYFKKHGYM